MTMEFVERLSERRKERAVAIVREFRELMARGKLRG